MNFNGKVCVITGGANGIGRCIAEEFLLAGANVAIIDIDAYSGKKLVARYGTERILFMHGDIAQKEVIEVFSGEVLRRFGRVDYLINNACLSKKGLLSGCGFEDFDYVLRLGVAAPYYLTKLLNGSFATGASVVNIASTRAFMSQSDTESYTAAKGGISALTHAMAVSLAGRVRVNAISPGWIETGAYQSDAALSPEHSEPDQLQHPVHRVGVPQDIAKTVLFLCSDDAAFITGENITVDGGMTKRMIYHNDEGWSYQP
ncbi:SDR family oxidoreductase [Acetanaerobacterium elongatum]|uniref:NAD(P)-dependent dehydrogenase, short-chain alcohol dehydrogenase family n=1 Tax=Acetanaerobacterium elongatum TaxID=258515 RepID=A0A1G9W2Y5_9FIRM|nr:SDR family oxidoreductase [Acetanaerobacterium elongatum]SDM78663.1 NAD(P)-dependent dehydrogenase, short-chain alcohol dehydrogenase family [Acetanaerobacterium elongatum]